MQSLSGTSVADSCVVTLRALHADVLCIAGMLLACANRYSELLY
jgi:hypothetical protein